MTRRLDAVIIGGGPAGISTAIALTHVGRAVAVLERTRYENVRVGETLPPAARGPLGELGVWERFLSDGHIPSSGIVSAWGQPVVYDNDFIFNTYGHGWHIDRRRFDAMLARAAETAGVDLHRDARLRSCSQGASGTWQVEAVLGGRPARLQAEFLVDATGRAAWLAQRQGSRRVVYDRLVGVVGFLPAGSQGQASDLRTCIEATADGWWYAARLPDRRTVVAYMTDSDLLPKGRRRLLGYWRERLGRSQQIARWVGRATGVSELRVAAAQSARLDRPVGNNWLAVGDAAAAYDPLAGQGVYSALE